MEIVFDNVFDFLSQPRHFELDITCLYDLFSIDFELPDLDYTAWNRVWYDIDTYSRNLIFQKKCIQFKKLQELFEQNFEYLFTVNVILFFEINL